eukprot:PhF_6_TR13553/c0_g1_i3/m.21664
MEPLSAAMPIDAWLEVALHCDPVDATTLMSTCRALHHSPSLRSALHSNKHHYWTNIYHSTFNVRSPPTPMLLKSLDYRYSSVYVTTKKALNIAINPHGLLNMLSQPVSSNNQLPSSLTLSTHNNLIRTNNHNDAIQTLQLLNAAWTWALSPEKWKAVAGEVNNWLLKN